ncbi:MAG: ATP synthase F1 subunit epsilon, partial [Actinobacteria bacterium]|nr:ATP synthase F1 subunit epsilon [Actinomycetota bacterium]
MAGNIRLEVVTPETSVVSEDAQIVVAPGALGEFGVLIGHTPFLTTLKLGMLRYKDANGVEKCVFISGGFAEALPDKVTVLAESAERRRRLDYRVGLRQNVRQSPAACPTFLVGCQPG